MSCETEATWMLYVDGELEAAPLRRAETHLVACERCRRTVMALREETDLLRAVLREHPAPAPHPEVAGPRAARGLALGLPLGLAATLAIAAALGRLLDLRPPAGAGWLRPSRFFGVNEMLFDLIFALRDHAPGLVEFGVAVAATASVAMLVTFAAGVALRRVRGPLTLGLGLALLLAVVGTADAARASVEYRDEEHVRLAADERLEATLFARGESVEIEGVLVGNLFAMSERVEIRGRVEGNVFAAARNVEVSGTITGSLHGAAEQMRVEGEVGGAVYVAADRLRLEPEARVGSDLVTASGTAELKGRVARDGLLFVRRLDLRGSFGGDLKGELEEGRIGQDARVGGDLVASLPDPERLAIAAGSVEGATDVQQKKYDHPRGLARYGHVGFYLWALVQLGMAFAVGLVLHLLFPGLFGGRVDTSRAFFVALGLGFAALLVVPVGLVLVALTIVGIPLALMGAAAALAALYLAGIEVAVIVGRALVGEGGTDPRSFGLALLVGLVVLAVATRLPFVGGALHVLVVLVGLGLLAERAWRVLRSRTAGVPAVP